jgi:tetratricopeptide (TPR) repeat protein
MCSDATGRFIITDASLERQALHRDDGHLEMLYPSRLAVVLGFLVLGCASSDRTEPLISPTLKSATLRERYQEAVEAYEIGDYATALVTLENVLDRFPPSAEREELLFIRADAYHQSRNFQDARTAYAAYLEAYPSGRYRAIATQGLMRIPAELAEPQTVAAERIDAARRDLDQLLAIESEFPRDPGVKYLIGNLYYQTADYAKAGAYYFEAQSLEAAYKEKDLIRQRLYIDDNGEPQAMTPSALRDLALQSDPLVVFDVYPYRERGTDALNSRLVFANVSGKVRNQAQRTLHDVVLEVRFLNALGDVLDVEVIPVGTIPPGGVRAFLASASHYDNLFNITDVEVLPRGA